MAEHFERFDPRRWDIDKVAWYAVLQDKDDNDWGSGNFDIETSIVDANDEREINGNPDVYIAVISLEDDDPVCVGEIHYNEEMKRWEGSGNIIYDYEMETWEEGYSRPRHEDYSRMVLKNLSSAITRAELSMRSLSEKARRHWDKYYTETERIAESWDSGFYIVDVPEKKIIDGPMGIADLGRYICQRYRPSYLTDEITDGLEEQMANYSKNEFERFLADLGWQDWMDDYVSAPDGEVADEAELKELDELIRFAWDHYQSTAPRNDAPELK